MRIHTLLPLLLGLSACGLQTTAPPPVDDTGTASFGDLVLNTTALDFGLVLVGETGQATLVLANSGTDPLSIYDAQLDNAAFLLEDAAELLPLSIAGGEDAELTISFTPDAPVDYDGELVLVTDIADAAEVSVSLFGSADENGTVGDDTGGATGGVLSLSSTSVDFGDAEVGEVTSSSPLTITNSGDEDVLIINLVGSDSKWGYGGELALPYVLEVGQSREVTLTVEPDAEVAITGTVTLMSDAVSGDIEIPVSAMGVDLCDICAPILGVYNAKDYSAELGLGLFGGSSGNVKLVNEGDQDLIVDSISTTSVLDAACTYNVSGFSGSKTVAPGKDFEVTVSYTKGTADACALSSGTLDVNSNGGSASFSLWVLGG